MTPIFCIDDYVDNHLQKWPAELQFGDKETGLRYQSREIHAPMIRLSNKSRLFPSSMTALPTPSQIAELDDERLEELARGWRAQALRGDRRA